MKKVRLVSFIVVLFVLAGCKKEKADETTEDKSENRWLLLGKWHLDQHINDNYQPADVLKYHDVTTGDGNDYMIFKRPDKIAVYEDDKYRETIDYTFLNDSTVTIGPETFVIRKLTSHNLYLHQETVDPNGYWREIIQVHFWR